MSATDLHREVIRLLVEVAWADREIAEPEREHILGIARSADLGDEEIRDIENALQDQGTLPGPDLVLLKKYRQEVARAVRVLTASDGTVSPDEADLIQRIDAMLEN